MKTKVNIVIAEDHPIFCEGLLQALARYPEFIVLDVVKRGDEVLDKVIQNTLATIYARIIFVVFWQKSYGRKSVLGRNCIF